MYNTSPKNWNSTRVPKLQKITCIGTLSILYTTGIIANYYDEMDREYSRSIITFNIHLLSTYLAFTSGIQSGLQHYLGCGIVQRRFNWVPHYRQIAAISGVLAAAFASNNSAVASRTVLYFLSLCYIGVAGNEYLYLKWDLAPRWMKHYTTGNLVGVLIGIALLLSCESQERPGKTPEI